jgi:opacity protein-like surface antigen
MCYNYTRFNYIRKNRGQHQEKGDKNMKTLATVVFTIVILLGLNATAFSQTAVAPAGRDYEVDGSFAFATGPDSFDAGWGFNFGAGYMLRTIDRNLQARFDISYYYFSYDNFAGVSLTYTRVPITVSGRYYFPINEKLKALAQFGLETSVDHFDLYEDGFKRSRGEVNLGVSPGAGIEFDVNPNVSLFVLGRAHLISDSYFSTQFGVASHF